MDHHSSHSSSEVHTSRSVWITTLPIPPLPLNCTYLSFSVVHFLRQPDAVVFVLHPRALCLLKSPPQLAHLSCESSSFLQGYNNSTSVTVLVIESNDSRVVTQNHNLQQLKHILYQHIATFDSAEIKEQREV